MLNRHRDCGPRRSARRRTVGVRNRRAGRDSRGGRRGGDCRVRAVVAAGFGLVAADRAERAHLFLRARIAAAGHGRLDEVNGHLPAGDIQEVDRWGDRVFVAGVPGSGRRLPLRAAGAPAQADRQGRNPMMSSVPSRRPHRGSAWSLARSRDRDDRAPRRWYDGGRVGSRAGRRRVFAVAMVLGVAVFAVVLLDLAGFDHRLAGAAIAVLTCDVFASWVLIARANRGSSRRLRRTPAPDQGVPSRELPRAEPVQSGVDRQAPVSRVQTGSGTLAGR
jgi:hypothetical protein